MNTKYISKVFMGFVAGVLFTAGCVYLFSNPIPTHMNPYQANIAKLTAENTDYRRVLFTGVHFQLVVMSIPFNGEVGQETHKNVEQILYFQSGTGEAILDGVVTPVGPGDVVIVTPGTEHNFRNTGTVPLQIFTTYAPSNHIDGTIEQTKADADANTEDEAFGEAQ